MPTVCVSRYKPKVSVCVCVCVCVCAIFTFEIQRRRPSVSFASWDIIATEVVHKKAQQAAQGTKMNAETSKGKQKPGALEILRQKTYFRKNTKR